MQTSYPEIEALNTIFIDYQVGIKVSPNDFLNGNKFYPKIELTLNGNSFHFYVDDEYDDLKHNYPLLNLCVVLRELEYYIDSSNDYSLWCKENDFNPENEKIQHYFDGLAPICIEIEKIIGKIDSKVSDWDFEMSSGAVGALRKLW